MNKPKLTTENAVIKTATVEVKTLTISGKQVTLAVFRQLEEREVFEPYGEIVELNGIVWGRVNYHPERCHSIEHIHIVWQEGNELRRGKVYPPGIVASTLQPYRTYQDEIKFHAQ